jgi:hypothetical protein
LKGVNREKSSSNPWSNAQPIRSTEILDWLLAGGSNKSREVVFCIEPEVIAAIKEKGL